MARSDVRHAATARAACVLESSDGQFAHGQLRTPPTPPALGSNHG